MELGMPLGLIATAVFERSLSAQKSLRESAAKHFVCRRTDVGVQQDPNGERHLFGAVRV